MPACHMHARHMHTRRQQAAAAAASSSKQQQAASSGRWPARYTHAHRGTRRQQHARTAARTATHAHARTAAETHTHARTRQRASSGPRGHARHAHHGPIEREPLQLATSASVRFRLTNSFLLACDVNASRARKNEFVNRRRELAHVASERDSEAICPWWTCRACPVEVGLCRIWHLVHGEKLPSAFLRSDFFRDVFSWCRMTQKCTRMK